MSLLHLLQVPDYLMVVKRPMDLSTLLTNIDEHKYVTVGEFMSDADLIWQNALEYNPDSDPMGETATNTCPEGPEQFTAHSNGLNTRTCRKACRMGFIHRCRVKEMTEA